MRSPIPWDYSALLLPPEGAMECSTELPCTERHLQVLWLEQKAFSPMLSASKAPIAVIHPGIWNHGPGPDFLHAHIYIGNTSYQGDVELHLSDSGWTQHGHAWDPRYEDVILHVSLEPPLVEKPLLTAQGRRLERAYLAPYLKAPLQTLLNSIDLDLYPSSSHTQPGTCAKALFDTLSQTDTRAFFHSAALWRLQQKRLFLTRFSSDPSMQCVIGMALALGYKQNARSMARLWLDLWPHRQLDKECLFAEALGRCDFFNAHYQKLWGESVYYQTLHRQWQSPRKILSTNEILPIVTAQQRPAHHPVRRLAALICLLQDPALLTFWAQFQALWRMVYEKPITHIKQALLQFLPDYKQPYWSTHYTFETASRPLNLALLGEERREILLINVFFPLLWEELLIDGDVRQQEAFLLLFASWRGPLSQKQRYVTQRFFSCSTSSAMMEDVMMQQGAFQLHSDFCTHYEASCVGCPFVARAQAQQRGVKREEGE